MSRRKRPAPLAKAARVYRAEDSFVAEGLVPLPAGKKSPPLAGRTGYSGETSRDTARDDADRWPRSNVGFRVPPWLVGVDVDGADHGAGKIGPDAIAELAHELGPLPATASSSRHGAESPTRIFFFAVPKGTRLSERRLESVELIQYHHRFAVVWPSRLRDGSRYRWYGADGGRIRVPLRAGVAELPETWREYLSDDTRRSAAAICAPDDAVQRWLDALPEGTPSLLLQAEVTAIRPDAVGNTNLLAHVGLAVRACTGRHGGREAFDLFIETIRAPYVEKYSESKFRADLERALARALADARDGLVTL